MQITGKTKILGIIGNPIEHSLSPVIQNQALNSLNLDYIYIPFPVQNEKLATVLNGFLHSGIKGFNVTIPHKQTVIPLLSKISETAHKIGAVNTVWLSEDSNSWQGTNTDMDGFIAPLQKLNRDWQKINPLVLGNGGASRAVIVGCEKLGCQEINVVGRNEQKLKDFLVSWQYKNLQINLNTYSWSKLTDLLTQSSLIINTTPVGMSPQINQSPLTEEQIKLIPADGIVYDLIYTPRPTLLLQKSQNQGLIAIDGTEMLVQQGAVAFNIWTQKPAPVDIMRQSLLASL